MIFEVFSIQPATYQNVNSVDHYTDNPIFIEGKGKYVKIIPDNTSVIVGDERLTTDYNLFLMNSTLKGVNVPFWENCTFRLISDTNKPTTGQKE
ncbi:hypothetical protein [Shimazuella kribbensis]|uniref:hypothetical protein n=1 Tax=Shimazuella kribbensis TaxID=139808 RepID=UPI0004002BD8|nr:hypothetical protein [Shimazuella kribbensis]